MIKKRPAPEDTEGGDLARRRLNFGQTKEDEERAFQEMQEKLMNQTRKQTQDELEASARKTHEEIESKLLGSFQEQLDKLQKQHQEELEKVLKSVKERDTPEPKGETEVKPKENEKDNEKKNDDLAKVQPTAPTEQRPEERNMTL